MTGINSLEYRIEQYLKSAKGKGVEQLARFIAFQCENGCKFEAGDFRVRQEPQPTGAKQ